MRSRWDEGEARACARAFARRGVPEALALRIYSARLLGSDPALVLHGGGNVSVKLGLAGPAGGRAATLRVKGSGGDMAAIGPEGLPALHLAPLLALRRRRRLDDRTMAALLRANLLDPEAPNPSVETLLHAFLPHAYVDHTHANASLAVTGQARSAALARETWGGRAAVVPYVMPGFALARACAEAFEREPSAEGLVLLGHGLVSFGASARESYERMIGLARIAEARLARGRARPRAPAARPRPAPARIAPVVRGLLCRAADPAGGRRLVLAWRGDGASRWLAGPDAPRRLGPATPDHALLTRPRPLVLPDPAGAGFAGRAGRALAGYARRHRDYVRRHRSRAKGPLPDLDPAPRVLLVPGAGLFGAGDSAALAGRTADLGRTGAEVAREAARIGPFRPLPEADLFDVEYWPLERAKLAGLPRGRLAGHVAAVTGGAGAIGLATARAFLAEGAAVALIDRDARALARAARETGALAVEADLRDQGAVERAFDTVALAFGGLDVLVSNAGAAWRGAIGEVDERDLRASFEVNFFAHQRAAQAALRVFRAQGLGGTLLFNVSKQALSPGPGLGAYGTAKAATLALMRQYALEYGREGVRANAVNPDRVRSGVMTEAMIRARAVERGEDVGAYMAGNLLGREVRAEDVGRAFVALALQSRTTAAVLTVDGGNPGAAVR